MNIDYYTEPFPFCIVRNYIPESNKLLSEIEKLKPILIDGRLTGSAINKYGEAKRNSGTFLYGPECPNNPILETLETRFNVLKNTLRTDGPFWYHTYMECNPVSSTLISHYECGDEYHSHRDEAILSALYYIWKEPKPFEGGDLYFDQFKVPIDNNCLLLFPSCISHRVSKLTSGGGRWVVTQFIIKRLGIIFPDDIYSYPSFLSEKDFNYVYNQVSTGSWVFNGFSNGDDKIRFWNMNLMEDDVYSNILLKRIEKLTGRKFKLDRVYANAQTYGLNGNWHIDNARDDAWTFIMYLNKDLENDGQTEFITSNGVKIIYPKCNTGVLFKSNIRHRGVAPSRFYTDVRMTIAWKLFEKKEEES